MTNYPKVTSKRDRLQQRFVNLSDILWLKSLERGVFLYQLYPWRNRVLLKLLDKLNQLAASHGK
jgi:hypothetical protein